MELLKAKMVTWNVITALSPSCKKIEVAGSVRREKPEVGDIELVLLPELVYNEMPGMQDMFAQTPAQTKVKASLSKGFINAISSLGSLKMGKLTADAGHLKIDFPSIHGVIQLDIFIPRPDDYYRQLAIRTGSSDFVFKHIAAGWRKMGWCGVKGLGLRKVVDCVNVNEGKLDGQNVRMKAEWQLVNPNPELPPVWRSEREFFDWINVKFYTPKYRI